MVLSLNAEHLSTHAATNIYDIFERLGYPVFNVDPFEGADLDQFEFDRRDRELVHRAFIVSRLGSHSIYHYEVYDWRPNLLRGLAWNALQRGGTALLTVSRSYPDVTFVHPFSIGKAIKSDIRVNKLTIYTTNPTRHDLDTLNAIHAHQRNDQEIYIAQKQAFDISTVTKCFYDEYRRHYEHARDVIRQYNPGVGDFYYPDKLHAFTQRLLGRLMFLYFLQRKGWLGGESRFLTDLYRFIQRQHNGERTDDGETFYFYREVLEPLFFETLNKERPGNITHWKDIRIPYLNGGLFDNARDPAGPVVIPDALFDPNDIDGLLNFFNRYNFTVADDTPLEQDVAVDPEMLGKVFENMLEEQDRGQSGSFYTPRSIVSYMCQESLAGYLEESADVPRSITTALFDPDVQAALLPDEATRMDHALDSLTVLDPAVGSGSFLVGMMNEIIRLRRAAYAAQHPAASDPSSLIVSNWKEAIISETLYGVDIKPEAIEIAQLRLWLALVVDQSLEQARPLPNLDYKLMAGNSLIDTIDGEYVLTENAMETADEVVTPTQPSLGLFEPDKERHKLSELYREYFHAKPDARKNLKPEIRNQERRIVRIALSDKAEVLEQIKNQLTKLSAASNGRLKASDERRLNAAVTKLAKITELQEELEKPNYSLPFFLYRLHFSDVFKRKGGFDIVVANPPYVRGELLGELKQELKLSSVYNGVYAGTADLYVYFYAKGYDLLNSHGQLAYVTSNKYLRANYGKGLRQFLSDNLSLNAIIDCGDLPVFNAAAYPCIVIGSKSNNNSDVVPAASVKDKDSLENLRGALSDGVKLSRRNLDASEWQIADARTQRVLSKLKGKHKTLGDYANGQIYRGVLTGFNEAFVITAEKRHELIAADNRSADLIKPWLRGRDVKRWRVESQDLYVIFTRRGIEIDKYPAIKAHLLQYKARLTPGIKGGRKPGTYKWYEIQDSIAYYSEFEKPKIIYSDIAQQPQFVYDDEYFFSGNTCYIIPDGDVCLTGILNSKVVEYFYGSLSPQIRGGYYRFFAQYVLQIPIPALPVHLREQITSTALMCRDAAKYAPEQLPLLEAQLNNLVYEAYDLDEDEIAVIEESLAR